MIKKIVLNEARIMNLLKEKKCKGIFTIIDSSKEFTNIFAKTKRKVKCIKNKDNYIFNIDLDIKGNIVSNELYKNLIYNPKDIKKLENEYKVDCIEIGRYAVAKSGRDSGIDWNKVVCNSKININVKLNIDRFGRGDF